MLSNAGMSVDPPHYSLMDGLTISLVTTLASTLIHLLLPSSYLLIEPRLETTKVKLTPNCCSITEPITIEMQLKHTTPQQSPTRCHIDASVRVPNPPICSDQANAFLSPSCSVTLVLRYDSPHPY